MKNPFKRIKQLEDAVASLHKSLMAHKIDDLFEKLSEHKKQWQKDNPQKFHHGQKVVVQIFQNPSDPLTEERKLIESYPGTISAVFETKTYINYDEPGRIGLPKIHYEYIYLIDREDMKIHKAPESAITDNPEELAKTE